MPTKQNALLLIACAIYTDSRFWKLYVPPEVRAFEPAVLFAKKKSTSVEYEILVDF